MLDSAGVRRITAAYRKAAERANFRLVESKARFAGVGLLSLVVMAAVSGDYFSHGVLVETMMESTVNLIHCEF